MTHSTVATEPENAGSVDAVYHTIDITSLDSAGTETFDPQSEVGVDPGQHGVAVVGQADLSYLFVWDHTNGQLAVVSVADGSDVAGGTAVGQVRLRITGV